MRTDRREIMNSYNPEFNSDRRTVDHARGISPHIKIYGHTKSQENIRGHELDKGDCNMVISNNPDLIKTPITVRGSNAVICNSPTDIYKLTAPNL